MITCLLDTDTLSEIFKQKNPVVSARANAYLKTCGAFTISIVTWYEVVRGLRAVNAVTKLKRFELFTSHSVILPASTRTFDIAADLWAADRARRQSTFDADLLIAATAIEHGMMLVTGNTPHFQWISQLVIDDWQIAATN